MADLLILGILSGDKFLGTVVRRIAKMLKATIIFVISVCLSVRLCALNNSSTAGGIL